MEQQRMSNRTKFLLSKNLKTIASYIQKLTNEIVSVHQTSGDRIKKRLPRCRFLRLIVSYLAHGTGMCALHSSLLCCCGIKLRWLVRETVWLVFCSGITTLPVRCMQLTLRTVDGFREMWLMSNWGLNFCDAESLWLEQILVPFSIL